jgi:hypothetical protein
MALLHRHALTVTADYHQFYVHDGGIYPPAPELWNEDDIANRSKVAEHVVVVCPLRAAKVRVELELHDTEPTLDLEPADHVVDCALHVPTGHLQVHECMGGPVLNVNVAPGTYRVRLSFRGLHTISADEATGDEVYQVRLWPGADRPLHVTRRWEPHE